MIKYICLLNVDFLWVKKGVKLNACKKIKQKRNP